MRLVLSAAARRRAAACLVGVAVACGDIDGTSDSAAETDSASADAGADTAAGTDSGAGDSASPDACDDVPVVTYASFGRGFMTQHCQACHASSATERYGAPDDVTFDSVDECWSHAERILIRAAGDSPSMPPNGGVSDDDRTLLRWWLECAEDGT